MNKNQAIKAKANWLNQCLGFGWSKDDLDGLSEIWDRHKDEYGNIKLAAPLQPAKDVEEKNYRKITLCGSTKFKKEFDAINKQLTLEGNVVYSVCAFGHADKIEWTKEQKELLDLVHKKKIDNSDAIFIIDVDGYIGESTQSEIDYAEYHGKVVKYLSQFPDLKMICDYVTLS